MGEEQELELIFKKFLEGTCNKQEFEILKKYLKTPEAETNIKKLMDKDGELIREYGSLIKDEVNSESKIQFNKILDAVGRRQVNPLYQRRQRKSVAQKRYIIGSLLIVALVCSWIIYSINEPSGRLQSWMEIETLPGHKSTVTLMDGSTVLLNSCSKLIYPKQFGDIREVVLVGEAFFMILKDEEKPFIIKSGKLTTTVLGTSFNIKAFQNENIEVTVANGQVIVAPAIDQVLKQEGHNLGQILSPNQQAVYDVTNNNLDMMEVDAEQLLVWRKGVLKFDHLIFEEAVKMLERWYGINIILENEKIGKCVLIGEFQNESLHAVLRTLEVALGIDYEFTAQGIVLRGKGCIPKE